MRSVIKHHWGDEFQQPGFQLFSLASLMILFWAVFDGIISYLTPLLITQRGFSKTTMGIIYSTSSVAGAIFDFILSKNLKNTHFRRVFLLMFALCAGYPLLLWKSNTAFVFVIAMAVWGLYYDLMNFGFYDLISRKSKINDHCANSAIIEIFKCIGYLIAPLSAGILIIDAFVGAAPFWAAFAFLFVSFLFYLLLSKIEKKQKSQVVEEKSYKQINVLRELHIWKKIGFVIWPALVFTALLSIFDAFFWTVGPLFSQSFPTFEDYGGLIMSAYTLPVLITGWTVSKLTKKFGKRKIAFVSTALASLFLFPLAKTQNPYLILVFILLSSFIGSLAWPAIKGSFADYITEDFKYEKEIEGLGDFATNFGYILGPLLAGILSDKLGNSNTLAVLGAIGAVISIFLLFAGPKKVHLPQRA